MNRPADLRAAPATQSTAPEASIPRPQPAGRPKAMIPPIARNPSDGTRPHAILFARDGRGGDSRPVPAATRSRDTRKARDRVPPPRKVSLSQPQGANQGLREGQPRPPLAAAGRPGYPGPCGRGEWAFTHSARPTSIRCERHASDGGLGVAGRDRACEESEPTDRWRHPRRHGDVRSPRAATRSRTSGDMQQTAEQGTTHDSERDEAGRRRQMSRRRPGERLADVGAILVHKWRTVSLAGAGPVSPRMICGRACGL